MLTARSSHKKWIYLAVCLLTAACLLISMPVLAQTETPQSAPSPVYIVQEGDSLWGIAARFGVAVADLQNANAIPNPNQLRVGDRLTIPGIEGFNGELVSEQVPFGETLTSLSRRFGLPEQVLIQLNRLSSPVDLYAGAPLILPAQDAAAEQTRRTLLGEGQSIIELAAVEGINPWSLANASERANPWGVLPGEVLQIPGQGNAGPAALPPDVTGALIDPLSLVQGRTVEVLLDTESALQIEGSLLDHKLNFFPVEGRGMVALQGLHALVEPGLYPLEIRGKTADGKEFAFSQMAPVKAGDYPFDQPLNVDPATIDPAVTKPEDAQWTALAQPVSSERLWKGTFLLPSPLELEYCLQTGDCWSSRFGNRRSYNGSAYDFFHAGLDVVGRSGTDIFAPADGTVVFAGPLTVRGNATMIDHGQGIYTGYMHQSEILVKPGDQVEAGQLIGRVGGTGRVQGPHLHWEVWAGGVQVDPLDWLGRVYP